MNGFLLIAELIKEVIKEKQLFGSAVFGQGREGTPSGCQQGEMKGRAEGESAAAATKRERERETAAAAMRERERRGGRGKGTDRRVGSVLALSTLPFQDVVIASLSSRVACSMSTLHRPVEV